MPYSYLVGSPRLELGTNTAYKAAALTNWAKSPYLLFSTNILTHFLFGPEFIYSFNKNNLSLITIMISVIITAVVRSHYSTFNIELRLVSSTKL